MKKRLLAALLLISILTTFSSCGKDNPVSNEDTTPDTTLTETTPQENATTSTGAYNYMNSDLTPYITVGNYRGLMVTRASDVLTDAEFEANLEMLRQNYSYYEEITDRAVVEGDTVIADYVGYIGDVAFEGGTATGSEVTVAEGSGYIDGFAEAFVGQMPGVEFSFNVTFPTVYGNLDLAGKEATFVCTVQYIRGAEPIVPELTDEFVKENFNYNNVDEFKIAYREAGEQQKKYSTDNEMYNDLWMQVLDASTVKSYPAREVDRIYNESRSMYEMFAQNYNMEYDEFLANYLGVSDDTLKTQASLTVKENLVMYQLVKDFGIIINEEKFNEELANLAEMYGATSEEMLEYYGKDSIMTSVMWQEVVKQIAEEAVITQADE